MDLVELGEIQKNDYHVQTKSLDSSVPVEGLPTIPAAITFCIQS